jgi:hypothetical protein
MNILDNAKKAINSAMNSTNITYGFVGITTVILSYYTFFENDIENPLNEPIENQSMYGGKNKRKKNI